MNGGMRIGRKVAHKLIQYIQEIVFEVENQAAAAAVAAAAATEAAHKAELAKATAVLNLRRMSDYINAHLELAEGTESKE